MDDDRDRQLVRIKAFRKLLVDRLGVEAWAARRDAYKARVREREAWINPQLPIETQLFEPAENDIDWYILVAELAFDVQESDAAYSSKRIYPYLQAIGAVADQLRSIPHVGAVLDKMLANNNKPETQIFELLTACFYLRNGYEVSFLPEMSITWPDGKTKKTPDLLVKSSGAEFYVECKRADKQTRYSQAEERAWDSIWDELSKHMLAVCPWSTIDLTFHDQVADVTGAEVINVVDLALKDDSGRAKAGSVSAQLRSVDKEKLDAHYRRFWVRPNCPQHELLVFGDLNSNEKRSIATIPKSIMRHGSLDSILNIFVEDVANCVGAQWRCDHEVSLDLRSRHFKGLFNDACQQIPPDKMGVVHIFFETREGIKVEQLRRVKNLANIAEYDASGSTVLGVLMHGVNYYPLENGYEWAETPQDFSRHEDFMNLFPNQTLMLAWGDTPEVEGETHWEQDAALRSSPSDKPES
ncbi:hypothetical protein [Pseudomonas putida]|uniref:hypothetical protein n=1 Tax=Pseudomonas putida TaxID=303 RepID=UPI0021174F2C|nr:hypothetical protein [Pseudomonas putida]